MTTDTTYNGWANYETWAVNLWLANDEGSYEWLLEMARQCEGAEYPRVALADTLKNEIVESAEGALPDAGLLADLLSAAISSVDFHEIASHYIKEVRETATA